MKPTAAQLAALRVILAAGGLGNFHTHMGRKRAGRGINKVLAHRLVDLGLAEVQSCSPEEHHVFRYFVTALGCQAVRVAELQEMLARPPND